MADNAEHSLILNWGEYLFSSSGSDLLKGKNGEVDRSYIIKIIIVFFWVGHYSMLTVQLLPLLGVIGDDLN